MIIDTDTSCLGLHKWMKDRGIEVVGRYYSSVHTYKNIKKTEAAELSASGIEIFVVYEDYGRRDDLNLTEVEGKVHGAAAKAQAKEIGQPEGGVIYFAVEGLDSGYKSSDLPSLRNYFKGVTAGLNGKFTAGVYGDGVVCKALREEGFCTHAWLAQASYSFEGSKEYYRSKLWNIAQIVTDLPKKNWKKLSVDINERNGDMDIGSFLVPVDVA